MSSSHKKAIVRMHDRSAYSGYLPFAGVGGGQHLELLDLAGNVVPLALADVKWVCFIRDFNSGEIDNPERLLKKTFASRPRLAGVWLRLRLTDNDLVEGLANNDLSLLDAGGTFLTPPDTRSNTQRMFVPRTSIAELEVVMVIGAAGKRKPGPSGRRPESET